ncbi:MAG: hypothetical protein ACXWDE_12530 [Aeromicrobium sp.]
MLEATIQGAYRSWHQSDLRAHSTNENPGSASDPDKILIPQDALNKGGLPV